VVINLDFLAVAVAGFFGAITRAALGKAIKAMVGTVFPLGTFAINLTGCFILSFFLTLTLERLEINPKLRLAIGTGFLGAFTTFSTFAVDSVNLIRSQQMWVSAAYILGTSFGCVVLAWLGIVTSRVLTGRRDKEAETSE
jgi:CrcB protein